MSTQIAKIEGRYEIVKSSVTFTPDYGEAKMNINRYYGGHKNRAMLQLTIQSDKIAYIQLTQAQVKGLITVLKDAFDYDKYPSE